MSESTDWRDKREIGIRGNIAKMSLEELQYALGCHCNAQNELLGYKLYGCAGKDLRRYLREALDHKLVDDILLGESL